jgi:hypothetical protein
MRNRQVYMELQIWAKGWLKTRENKTVEQPQDALEDIQKGKRG